MKHPTADELLLLAYGEVADAGARMLEVHLVACATCRQAFERLERTRVALDTALARRRPVRFLVPLVLAVAAVLAVVLVARSPAPVEEGWRPLSAWSANAGYVTGGAVMEIDTQLTRLEQERYYGLPN